MRNHLTGLFLLGVLACSGGSAGVPAEFADPPREFSVMPFWFWNDDLREDEILRQIADFDAHGVYGFVIHPRIGLPNEIAWMSPRMLGMMRVAIAEAARRAMKVVLYDEGMYPSGSSSGQVVARNPAHAARGLWKIDLAAGEEPALEAGWTLVTVLDRPGGKRLAVVDRPSRGVIRGIHYIGEGTGKMREEEPPAADVLNPAAVASFMDLVHERYAQEFGKYFGTTILGVFTEEPSEMGRGAISGMVPGSSDVLKRINQHLGYDFTPYLADLWYADRPDSEKHRRAYRSAVHLMLGETYYRPLNEWCAKHGIALMGHPGSSTDLGFERYFHVPGQDLVWRYVEPGPTALAGEHSTMAKCASSAMLHLGRRRNSNELYGAYGHNLTFSEVKWLANWCFVRGQNLLYPHAFYYSVRGPRRDERPPDVGPNAEWWPRFKPYADACRRLCWINTDSRQVCATAVLAAPQQTPDRAAAVLFQNQRDFNYLEWCHLWEDARVDESGVRLAGMTYTAVILDQLAEIPAGALPALRTLAKAGRLVSFRTPSDGIGGIAAVSDDADLMSALDRLAPPDIVLDPPSKAIRVRHVIKNDRHIFFVFNEGSAPVTARLTPALSGAGEWWDAETAAVAPADLSKPVTFAPFEMKLLSLAAAPQ